jgi:hypothetical protein
MRSFVNIPYLVRSRIASVKVKASDDEDMVPILSGRRKSGFTPREYEQVRYHVLEKAPCFECYNYGNA